MSQINWIEDLDDNDNTYWEGNSPYVDGEDGPFFKWRLVQALLDNKIQWADASDEELVGDNGRNVWGTIEEAKADCQEGHNNILTEEL